jgi:hypothetical protein
MNKRKFSWDDKVKFQVMEIFPENIEVLENLPAKAEIFQVLWLSW